MNHPYEQLADLVDGTLDEENLAGVQAHLDTCATCREDVAHATAGRKAAGSLRQTAPPADLHRRVIVAAGGRGHGAPTSWYRWAGVAAAAAVVVAIAIALPNVGGGGNKDRAGVAATSLDGRSEAQDATSGARPEVVDKNYDTKGLERLASAVASDTVAAETGPQPASADSAAAGCVSEAFKGQPVGQLTRLIQARFEGREAYIAVYLEGPGAGEPPDTAVVWAAARDDCTILSVASARI